MVVKKREQRDDWNMKDGSKNQLKFMYFLVDTILYSDL